MNDNYIQRYKLGRELGLGRIKSAISALPVRLQLVWAIIKNKPIGYKLTLGKNGSLLYFDKEHSGAYVARCTFYGDSVETLKYGISDRSFSNIVVKDGIYDLGESDA